jgi:hypothetical protein
MEFQRKLYQFHLQYHMLVGMQHVNYLIWTTVDLPSFIIAISTDANRDKSTTIISADKNFELKLVFPNSTSITYTFIGKYE